MQLQEKKANIYMNWIVKLGENTQHFKGIELYKYNKNHNFIRINLQLREKKSVFYLNWIIKLGEKVNI